MDDVSRSCTHLSPHVLKDEILEDFIDYFLAKHKPPSHYIVLMVSSSYDMNEEELSGSHEYVPI